MRWNGRRASPGYRYRMGFNPFREPKNDPIEVIALIVGLAITLGLIAWAIFSG